MFLGKAPASCYCNPEVRHVYKRKGRLCSDLLLICVNILHFIISPSLSQLKCGLGINTAPALTKNWNLHIWTSQGVRVFLFLLPCARRVCFRIDNLIPYTINTWPDGPEFPLFSFNTDWILWNKKSHCHTIVVFILCLYPVLLLFTCAWFFCSEFCEDCMIISFTDVWRKTNVERFQLAGTFFTIDCTEVNTSQAICIPFK